MNFALHHPSSEESKCGLMLPVMTAIFKSSLKCVYLPWCDGPFRRQIHRLQNVKLWAWGSFTGGWHSSNYRTELGELLIIPSNQIKCSRTLPESRGLPWQRRVAQSCCDRIRIFAEGYQWGQCGFSKCLNVLVHVCSPVVCKHLS